MATLAQIMHVGVNVRHGSIEGRFEIDPPVALKCVVNGLDGITKDEIVYADRVDHYRYPGTVQLVGKAYWWRAEYFDIVEEEVPAVVEAEPC